MKLGENMKKKSILVILLILIGASILAGCTGSAGAASSWPGVTVDEDLALVSYGYQIYALNTQNGSKVWTYPAEQDRKIMFYAPAAVANGTVLVGDYANSLHAINRSNGVSKWVFDGADSRYIASVLVANGNVYAPNADGKLYVLTEDGMLNWVFETQGPNWSQPVADENFVYLASMDHKVYALQSNYEASQLSTDENGNKTLVSEPVWELDLGTAVVSDPLLVDGNMYVGTLDGKLFKINTADGAIVWVYEDGSEVSSIWTKPVLMDGLVFFATESGDIYALNAEDGNEAWAAPLSTNAQIVGDGVIINDTVAFGTTEGELVIVDKDQNKSPSLTKEGSIYTSPIFEDGKLFLTLVGGDNLVFALDENGRQFWAFSTKE